MKRIIYTRPDGGLSVVHPVINTRPPEEITEDQAVARAFAKLPADAVNPQIVEADTIPTDRTFREAWSHGGTSVNIDMAKAVEIHKESLRALRAKLFVANDVALRDALISGDKAALDAAVATRDALRNVTDDPALAAAKTPEELKAIVPEVLSIDVSEVGVVAAPKV